MKITDLNTKLEPPRAGVLYLLENDFLTNQDPVTLEYPTDEPIEFYLGMCRKQDGHSDWFLHTIRALNHHTASMELAFIADREDVMLIESRSTVHVVRKDWRSRELCASNSNSKDPGSCLNRAADNEMLFVLRSHDTCAPAAIRAWCQHRILRGKNKPEDPEIQEALAAADIMERER